MNDDSKIIMCSMSEDLSFVDELPKHVEIECPICLQVMQIDPHQVSCCGRRFCGPCIERVKDGPCPMCKDNDYQTMIDKERLRIINGLQVYCTNMIEGCRWKGDLKDLSTHLSKGKREGQCWFEEVKCRHEKCQEKKQRLHLEDHEANDCSQRLYQCQYCSVTGTFLYITKEHFEECSQYLMSCPNLMCGIKFPRSSLGSHLSNECPLQPVECPFSWAGCTDKPLRKDSHLHTTDLKHMSLLAIACGQLKKENIKVITDCHQLRQENEMLSVTCAQLKVENEQISTNCTHLRQENEKIKRHLINTYPLLPVTLGQGAITHAYTHLFGHRISVKFSRLDMFGRGHVHLAFHKGAFDDLQPKLPKISIVDDYYGTIIPLLQDTLVLHEKLDDNILRADPKANGVITVRILLALRPALPKLNIVISWD